MAEWRDFDASNDPNTCIWCGKKLRFKVLHSHYETSVVPVPEDDPNYDPIDFTTRKIYKNVVDERATTGGDYQDGFFCGLRCAYQFGVRMAQLGRRLQGKR